MKQLMMFDLPVMTNPHKEILKRIRNIEEVARCMRAAGVIWWAEQCEQEIKELIEKLDEGKSC